MLPLCVQYILPCPLVVQLPPLWWAGEVAVCVCPDACKWVLCGVLCGVLCRVLDRVLCVSEGKLGRRCGKGLHEFSSKMTQSARFIRE